MDIITQNFKNLGDMTCFTLFILCVISSTTKINKDTLEEAFVTSKVMKSMFPIFYLVIMCPIVNCVLGFFPLFYPQMLFW